MSADACRADDAMSEDDFAQSLLEAYGGDAVAALRSVIADAEFLHGELYTASCLLSKGVARGWVPRFQREQANEASSQH